MNAVCYIAALLSMTFLGTWASSCDPNKVTACTMDLRPVCATFKKTFPNRCSMEAALCGLAKEGFEFTEEVSNSDCCVKLCTLDYKKVCGSDGHVYSNKCMMGTARCQKKDWIEEVEMSQCEEPQVEK